MIELTCEDDYDRALRLIAGYFEDQPKRGSADAADFDALSELIEAYEARWWAIVPDERLDP